MITASIMKEEVVTLNYVNKDLKMKHLESRLLKKSDIHF